MKIVVGLGNPGERYRGTPHSIGFEAVDFLAERLSATWAEKRQYRCLIAEVHVAGERVLLVKPQTYMNLSGESVAPILRYSNATAHDLTVVQDDVDLAPGRIKIRSGGSCGGHNGIRNIIERTGCADFVRVKIGVGKKAGGDTAAHVLGKFSPEDRALADLAVKNAADAVEAVITRGVQKAMNEFNCIKAPDAPKKGNQQDGNQKKPL